MTIRQTLRTSASVGVVAVSLALTACGDSQGGDSGASDDDPQSAQLRYSECMRDSGVEEFPDPDPSGMVLIDPGAAFSQDPDFDDAEEACADLLQDVTGGGAPGGGVDGAQQEVFLAMARCMRDKGFDMRDPSFEDGQVRVGLPDGGVDFEDPAFQAASDECSREVGMPRRGEGPIGVGGPTP